ncbi:hypothetical protein [Agromyces kandeliae]|uniref:AbiEi antitoxin C-terminal domain-containing protein n=1 Tax=Agromyces kandeliae TaxID=2666141 RepID=A0A6L5R042_9MICO|nr:hypothetical protein [Agromyces kandeliae]MRX43303.1 hypothetical protein [Agromyces kandeliae]
MAETFPMTAHGFVLARDARAAGREAELYAAAEAGRLSRVRVGVFREVEGEVAASGPERDAARYRDLVRAAGISLAAPVFTSYAAVALAGLPIVGAWPCVVHVMSRDEHGSRRGDIVRVARTAEIQTVPSDGLTATSIEFSLIQLARHASLAAALVATDAALHVSRSAAAPPPLITLAALRAEHERLLPYHGSRRVGEVLSRATTDADSPLETMSRLVVEECGLPDPVLQHRMRLADLDRDAYLDFWWPDHGIVGEADGRGKYLSGDAGTAVAAVLAEKAREDAIRASVVGFVRWDWSDMWRRAPIRDRLVAAGLPIVRKPVRLIVV